MCSLSTVPTNCCNNCTTLDNMDRLFLQHSVLLLFCCVSWLMWCTNTLPEDIKRSGGEQGGRVGGLIATLVTLMTINTLSICQETMRKGGLRWWWATLKTLIQHLSTSFEVRHGVDRGGRAGPAVKKGRSGRLWPPPIHMLPSCLKTKSNRPSPSHCPG